MRTIFQPGGVSWGLMFPLWYASLMKILCGMRILVISIFFWGLFGVSGLISSFPDLDCSCGLATTLFGSTRCTRALLATFSVLSRDGVMEVTVPPRFPCWCSYSRFSTKHCDATFTKCINALRGGLDWETDTLHLAVPHMCCFLLLLYRFYMNSR